jgi:hypothetical protein
MTDFEASRVFWKRMWSVPSLPLVQIDIANDDDEMWDAHTVDLDDEENPLLHEKAPETSTCAFPRRAVAYVLEWLDVL